MAAVRQGERLAGRIQQFMHAHRMTPGPDEPATVVAGLSGGGDSTALLYILHYLQPRLGFRLAAAHLNHALRRDESDDDQAFCFQLAAKLHVPIYCRRMNVAGEAQATGLSIEMAARRARHRFYRELNRSHGPLVFALGHTADDQAETLLLKLCRGSGSDGLAGMKAITDINGLRLIRPLLEVSRDELRSFLTAHGLSWREDRSNHELEPLRNRMRHEVLPLLEERINPRILTTLSRTAHMLRDEQQWMEEMTRQIATRCLDKKGLRKQPVCKLPAAAQRRLIRHWVRMERNDNHELNFAQTETVRHLLFRTGSDACCILPDGTRIFSEYEYLRRGRPVPAPTGTCRLTPGENLPVQFPYVIRVQQTEATPYPAAGTPGQFPAECLLSTHVLQDGLFVRAIRAGDRIQPTGLKGSRKISRILIDAKVPKRQREQLPLICCGHKPAWLPGYRIDHRFAVPARADQAIRIVVLPHKNS